MNNDAACLLALVPGVACDQAVWQPVMPDLAEQAQCWVANLPALDSIPALAAALLRTVPADRFALAGHSLGGRIALEVVRQAPDRVLRLALLDTGWQPCPPGNAGALEKSQREGLVAIARQHGMRTMAEQWAPAMLHPAPMHGPLYEAVLAMVAAQPVERFAAQQQALLRRPDAQEVLDTLRCPTLVLCGREDAWSPLARHCEMASRMAGAELVVVEDCGHMSPMAQPRAVAAALRQWLVSQPTAAA